MSGGTGTRQNCAPLLEKVRDLGVGGVLVGNIGHLSLTRDLGLELYGDYGLNVFNSRSLDYLRQKGLSLRLRLL